LLIFKNVASKVAGFFTRKSNDYEKLCSDGFVRACSLKRPLFLEVGYIDPDTDNFTKKYYPDSKKLKPNEKVFIISDDQNSKISDRIHTVISPRSFWHLRKIPRHSLLLKPTQS
jgi:hypothetical protein